MYIFEPLILLIIINAEMYLQHVASRRSRRPHERLLKLNTKTIRRNQNPSAIHTLQANMFYNTTVEE